MKNKVTVTIAQQQYTLIADQDSQNVELIAAHVDEQVSRVMEGGRLSLADGAVLACMNIAEEYFKEQQSGENLRRQLKAYAEDMAKLNQELSQLKRENFRLQQGRK